MWLECTAIWNAKDANNEIYVHPDTMVRIKINDDDDDDDNSVTYINYKNYYLF